MVAMMWLRLLTYDAISTSSLLAGAAAAARRRARPRRGPSSVSGFWPAIIGLSPRMQALEVEDQVVGCLVAVLAVLGHHRLDDHAQAAGEPGIEVVGRDDARRWGRRACASPRWGSRRRRGPGR